MKISGSNILLTGIIVVLLLISIVSAIGDSEYCTPLPTGLETIIDHNGDWWNITIKSSTLCYTCRDNGAGYGDVDCVLCSGVIAGFTSNVTCGNVPFSVQYTDTSTGTNITSWYWDFGDGMNTTAKNPVINYTVAGFYGVDHSATNSMGTNWSNVSGYLAARVPGDVCAVPSTGGVQYDTNTYKPGWFNSWWI